MPSWTWRTDGFVLLSRSFLHAAGVVIFLSHTVSEPPPAADGGLQLLAELLDLAALLLRFCLPLPLLGLQLIDPLLLSIQVVLSALLRILQGVLLAPGAEPGKGTFSPASLGGPA